MFAISIASPNIVEIERKCDAVADDNNFTLRWLESQRQVAVIDNDEDNLMPIPKRRRVSSAQKATQLWNFDFAFAFTAEQDVRPIYYNEPHSSDMVLSYFIS